MKVSAGDLLRVLGSGVRPEGAGDALRALGGKSFEELLGDVRAGRVSSGRPVRIGAHAGVELAEDQLARLAVVADAGEAAGATRLAAMIDGRVVTLDIMTRTIESAQDGEGVGVLTGIDGFVVVPGEMGAGAAGLFAGGGTGVRIGETPALRLGVVGNRSVAELLGGLVSGGGRGG